jgi:hypothetical protein
LQRLGRVLGVHPDRCNRLFETAGLPVFVTYHVAGVHAAESKELYLGQHRLIRNCRVIHYSRCAAGMAIAE